MKPNIHPRLLDKEHLTIIEACTLTGVSAATIKRWIEQGYVKCTYRRPTDKWGMLVELRSLLVHWYFVYVPEMLSRDTQCVHLFRTPLVDEGEDDNF